MAPSATPKARSVLIVEDHEDTRTMYRQYLEAFGFHVVEAATCAETLAHATANHVDVVVLDRGLADGDGLDACRALRADPRTKGLRIIVLSGHPASEKIDADAYLLKPVVPDVLAAEIERALARPDARS
jgi:two-component system, OmpR family, phosphate regulon response regulator OmpR